MHCGDKPAAEPGKSYDLRTAPRLITRRAALASGRVSLITIGELRSTRDTGMFEMNVSIVQRVDRIHSKRVRGGGRIYVQEYRNQQVIRDGYTASSSTSSRRTHPTFQGRPQAQYFGEHTKSAMSSFGSTRPSGRSRRIYAI